MLVSGLHMASLALSETELKVSDDIKVPSKRERDERIQQIRTGFINRLHLNRPWAYGLTFCEILNLLNVFLQIYVTDWFLGGAFLGLGRSIAEPVSKDEMDPLDIVFPKVRRGEGVSLIITSRHSCAPFFCASLFSHYDRISSRIVSMNT